MTCEETLAELSRLGDPQTRRTYARHGDPDAAFGVKFGDLNKIARRLKINHPLALALWKTGKVEARILALMIADAKLFTAAEAERWVQDIRWHLYSGYLATLVAKTPFADDKMRAWVRSPAEYVRETGYNVLIARLKVQPDEISDKEARQILSTIEKELHGSENRARAAMNMAVAAIGIYKPTLRDDALASARRIGKVEVDHGDTACKTPDAAEYIHKAAARPAKKTPGKPKPAPRKST